MLKIYFDASKTKLSFILYGLLGLILLKFQAYYIYVYVYGGGWGTAVNRGSRTDDPKCSIY